MRLRSGISITFCVVLLASLPNGDQLSHAAPTPVVEVAAGGLHSLVLTPDGTVWAFGNNQYGELGVPVNDALANPAPLRVMSGGIAIATGTAHSLVITGDHGLWSFGDNFYGQLGSGGPVGGFNATPAQVMSNAAAVAAGGSHSLVLKTDGTVWSFGDNTYGQLGHPPINIMTSASSVPEQVMSDATAVSAGLDHSLVLKSDGTVWSFGNNVYGQLGVTHNIGDFFSNPEPVEVMSGAVAIAAGGRFSLVLKTDGTVWSFGNNRYGQLGRSTNTGSDIANAIPEQAMTNASAIAAGGTHSLVLKSDGTLWSFGENYAGQLGNQQYTPPEVPSPLPRQVMSAVSTMSGGGTHSLVAQTDGSAWSFGNNRYGELGNPRDTGNFQSHPTPALVQIGSVGSFSNSAGGDLRPAIRCASSANC